MSRKEKARVRDEMKVVLANLDERWLQPASRDLSRRLSELVAGGAGREIRHVLAWMSFFPGEVELSTFIDEQLDRRAIYLPQVHEDRSMTFVSLGAGWLEGMASGPFGIPEPEKASGRAYDPQDADTTAVIVPGLAFDRAGHRLGRGKGFYDRFLGLPELGPALKVGACWSLQLVNELPRESHDVAMDWICTERELVRAAGAGEA